MTQKKKQLKKSLLLSLIIYSSKLFSLHLLLSYHFRDLKSDSTNAGYFKAGRKSALPVLNTTPSYFLLPIPALSSQGHRYLKLFGTWTAIAASQAFLP